MITPSPTTKIDPTHARGVLEDIIAPTATKPGYIVLSVPNSSYQLHLIAASPVDPAGRGKRLIGRIAADARRVDLVETGGRYVEPVMGRPRRVQGTIIAIDASNNAVTINAGVPINCTLTDARQKASQFEVGQVVTFDVLEGASFTPSPLPDPAGS